MKREKADYFVHTKRNISVYASDIIIFTNCMIVKPGFDILLLVHSHAYIK